MAEELMAPCNLCLADSERQEVVAVYWNKKSEKRHTCRQHFDTIKLLGLDYEMLEKVENL